MITSNITAILYVTGIITTSMIFYFIAPGFFYKKLLKHDIGTGATQIIERHWAVTITITGLLLIWAGYNPAIRVPVVACVGLNKGIFVLMMLFNYKKEFFKNFGLIIFFDVICVALYGIYLTGLA